MSLAEAVVVGDVHLDAGDPELDPFVRFLEGVGRRTRRLILMGDLFELWLGRRELEQPHHRRVVEVLASLRRRGVWVGYTEGNRDFHLGPVYRGVAFDAVTDQAMDLDLGGRRYVFAHGDLANPEDRNYRRWRRFARSAALWRAWNLLPARTRLRLARRLERALEGTNLAHKRTFPEEAVRAYARELLGQGQGTVVLGHFHREHVLEPRQGSRARVLVTPLWKESRRVCWVDPAGEARFGPWAG